MDTRYLVNSTIATLLSYNLDTVLVRRQTGYSPNISKNVGVLSAGIGRVTFFTCYFNIYEKLRKYNNCPSSILAGISSSIITNPIWYYKILSQTSCDSVLSRVEKVIKSPMRGVCLSALLSVETSVRYPIYLELTSIGLYSIPATGISILATFPLYPLHVLRDRKRAGGELLKNFIKDSSLWFRGYNIYLLKSMVFYSILFILNKYNTRSVCT